MVLVGAAGMTDFYLWEYDYGHNLKENAAIKFTNENGEPMAYQPPLIGAKKILNFRAISAPMTGTYLLILGMALSLTAFYLDKKTKVKSNEMVASIWLILLFCSSCTIEPQPITYGLEACSSCKMTIVDPRFASEIVTRKGKVFKYDAIECMLHDVNESVNKDVKLLLSNIVRS